MTFHLDSTACFLHISDMHTSAPDDSLGDLFGDPDERPDSTDLVLDDEYLSAADEWERRPLISKAHFEFL
jgi:hypothetical protein